MQSLQHPYFQVGIRSLPLGPAANVLRERMVQHQQAAAAAGAGACVVLSDSEPPLQLLDFEGKKATALLQEEEAGDTIPAFRALAAAGEGRAAGAASTVQQPAAAPVAEAGPVGMAQQAPAAAGDPLRRLANLRQALGRQQPAAAAAAVLQRTLQPARAATKALVLEQAEQELLRGSGAAGSAAGQAPHRQTAGVGAGSAAGAGRGAAYLASTAALGPTHRAWRRASPAALLLAKQGGKPAAPPSAAPSRAALAANPQQPQLQPQRQQQGATEGLDALDRMFGLGGPQHGSQQHRGGMAASLGTGVVAAAASGSPSSCSPLAARFAAYQRSQQQRA